MQRRLRDIARSVSKCSRLRDKLSMWPSKEKPQMPVEKVSMETVWVEAVAPLTTSPKCQAVVEVELDEAVQGLELDGVLGDPQHLKPMERQRRSQNGSYRACNSGKLWGRPNQIMQEVEPPISIRATKRVKIQTIEFHVNSVAVSLPRRLLRGTYHIVRASTRLI